MAIQTMDDAQGKADRRVDRSLHQRPKKRVPLSEQTLPDLQNRGASLAEQFEWLKIQKKIKDQIK